MIKRLKGFVIKPPISDNIPWWQLSYTTFGITPFEAWVRHCQSTYDDPDISRKIQAWMDRGYRLCEATLMVEGTKDEVAVV